MTTKREDIQCPYCKNERVHKVGKYATITEKKQRYKCPECGRSFY